VLMTTLTRPLVILILVLLPVAPSFGGAIEDIREKQKGLVTVRAHFKQEKRTELLERPIRSEGKFYFKSPVGVRWEYDEAMVVVYDGKSLYLHYTELDEAEKIDGVSGYVGPLSFDLERRPRQRPAGGTASFSGRRSRCLSRPWRCFSPGERPFPVKSG
jgi:hypothetical protein